MTTPPKTARFRELHRPGDPLIMPNPWDLGSARAMASLGFAALATTSSGFAATLGRNDMGVSREEALAHAAAMVSAVDVPVSADLENGFGRDPAAVTRTVTGAVAAGLAGCSIEDNDPETPNTVYDIGLAAERIAAAVEAAHGQLVLTARAENFIRGNPDLDDTVARLRRYAEAGADVVMVPGLTSADDIKAVVGATDRPVNIILSPRGPDVPGLAALGVSPHLRGRVVHLARLRGPGRRGSAAADRRRALPVLGTGPGRPAARQPGVHRLADPGTRVDLRALAADRPADPVQAGDDPDDPDRAGRGVHVAQRPVAVEDLRGEPRRVRAELHEPPGAILIEDQLGDPERLAPVVARREVRDRVSRQVRVRSGGRGRLVWVQHSLIRVSTGSLYGAAGQRQRSSR